MSLQLKSIISIPQLHHKSNTTRSNTFNAIKFDNTGQYILAAGSNRIPSLYNPHTALLINQYNTTTSDNLQV